MRYTFKTAQWVPFPVEAVFAFFANPDNLPRLMPAWQRPRIEKANFVSPPNRSIAAGARDLDKPNPGTLNASGLNSGREGLAAGAGSQFTISFRPFPYSPIRLRWEASIVEFEWSDHFCDEQGRGPFGYWRHCHRVHEERRGEVVGTCVLDELVYELPFGFLPRAAGSAAGSVINSLFMARQIRGIFTYRQARLMQLLTESDAKN